jgi:HlyD family secretion protein
MKRKYIAIIFVAACALILGAFVLFYSKDKLKSDKAVPPTKAALTVTTELPVTRSLPIALSANGSIAAWQEAIISSESEGLKLVEVKANVGDRVRAGQVLATFSSDRGRAEVAQAKASLGEAQANALEATGNADKARTLQASGALSDQQINQYLTLATTAQAKLEASRAALNVQQLRLTQTRLLAPDDGVISSRNATVGAVVGSGVELFKMIRGGRLEWRAETTSAEVARIKPGDRASVLAASGARVEGRVRMVAPTVDTATRTALVYVDLPLNADLKAGMYAKGDFALGASDALTLQQQTLVLRDGFTYAMRVEENNTVRLVKLQTGRRAGDAVEIVQGARLGEKFVSRGAGFLADGDTVKIVQQATPAATTTTSTSTATEPATATTRPIAGTDSVKIAPKP